MFQIISVRLSRIIDRSFQYLLDINIRETCAEGMLKHLSDQGTFTPVGAQGGPWNPQRKPLSYLNFAMKFAPYMYGVQKITILKKKNVVPFQNGGQITDFYFASFCFWPKFEKHFPKGIFK